MNELNKTSQICIFLLVESRPAAVIFNTAGLHTTLSPSVSVFSTLMVPLLSESLITTKSIWLRRLIKRWTKRMNSCFLTLFERVSLPSPWVVDLRRGRLTRGTERQDSFCIKSLIVGRLEWPHCTKIKLPRSKMRRMRHKSSTSQKIKALLYRWHVHVLCQRRICYLWHHIKNVVYLHNSMVELSSSWVILWSGAYKKKYSETVLQISKWYIN